MYKPGGYLIGTGPEGIIEEVDTFTCVHCNSVHKVLPRQRPEDIGGLCKICMGLICGPCADHGACVPFERRLQEQEARYHARRNYEIE